jgi:hypothetical protein
VEHLLDWCWCNACLRARLWACLAPLLYIGVEGGGGYSWSKSNRRICRQSVAERVKQILCISRSGCVAHGFSLRHLEPSHCTLVEILELHEDIQQLQQQRAHLEQAIDALAAPAIVHQTTHPTLQPDPDRAAPFSSSSPSTRTRSPSLKP